ncbi:hypothetical protein HONESTABE_14 [Bacillus phage HonestAbe]|nr:hypothetical protein HONESTABE_14 [Bacillus phage HonestAbe]
MKVDELVLADVDYPEEAQLVSRIEEDYLYILAEEDKSIPREGNTENREFFIGKITAQKMYDQLKAIRDPYKIRRQVHTDLEGNEFYIAILEGTKEVFLVDYETYVGATVTYDDAIKFREYLWIFINREEIGVEV